MMTDVSGLDVRNGEKSLGLPIPSATATGRMAAILEQIDLVVAKVERLARSLGLTKTAVVERAIDRLASKVPSADPA